MIKFDVTYTLPQHHFIDFTMYIEDNKDALLNIHLPSWRPGRYEIGNFAQNVQQVTVTNAMQQPLKSFKTGKDTWQIEAGNESQVIIRYRYYAAVLNAGSSYLDETQLYLNPVNCFMFAAGRTQEPIQVRLVIPGNYHVATQLPKLTKHTLIADNYDTLADSPLIASSSMKHLQYRVDTTDFHIWFQGEVVLDEKRIVDDFTKFTLEQIKLFGDCECKDYHFLMQMLPVNFHHGVEHLNSSVNALGPGIKLMEDALYNDFVGLCSHELFHLWNVKRIRPTSMLPYQFDKENYSNMGYVYEGVTTYYGDLILWRSGVYTFEQLCAELDVHLNKHFNNYGRYNHSLADSSTDTWLDGYAPGIPDRKVNIYTEGLLAALILDAHCISQTEGEYCLDDMLKQLYTDAYKRGLGYDEAIWKATIESITGHRYDWYFDEIIHGRGLIEKHLDKALALLGLQMQTSETDILQNEFGIRAQQINEKVVIYQVAPNSNAYLNGVAIGDQIIELNSVPVSNLEMLLLLLGKQSEPIITIIRNNESYDYTLQDKGSFFMNHHLMQDAQADTQAERNFNKWMKPSKVSVPLTQS